MAVGTASVGLGLGVGGITSVGVGTGTAVGVVAGVGNETAVSAEAGVTVPARWVPVRMSIVDLGSGAGVGVGAGIDASGIGGVGVGAGSAPQPMMITAAPISKATRNAGDMCFRHCFNLIGLLPLEWMEISSGAGSTRPPSPCLRRGLRL